MDNSFWVQCFRTFFSRVNYVHVIVFIQPVRCDVVLCLRTIIISDLLYSQLTRPSKKKDSEVSTLLADGAPPRRGVLEYQQPALEINLLGVEDFTCWRQSAGSNRTFLSKKGSYCTATKALFVAMTCLPAPEPASLNLDDGKSFRSECKKIPPKISNRKIMHIHTRRREFHFFLAERVCNRCPAS